MRTVARQLNMATMSIYRYVTSREQLEELIVEALFSELDIAAPRGGSWRRRIATLVERVRDALRAHPQVVPLALPHRLTFARGLRFSETVLSILADAGLTIQERDVANRSLMIYVIGSLQFEHFGPLSGTGTATVASLNASEYPFLAQSAGQTHRLTRDEEFGRGLDVVLDGLEALSTGPSSPTRRRRAGAKARRPPTTG